MAPKNNCKYKDHAQLIIDKDLSIQVLYLKSIIIQHLATVSNGMDLSNAIANATIVLSSDED